MSGKSRWDYLKAIYFRYKKDSNPLRARILGEFCQVCGYNRKYAIRLLGGPAPQKPKNRGHVYEFVNLPSSFLVDFSCDAVGPPYYCHQQGMIRRPLPVEELFINTDPEDGGDVDHV